MGFVVNGSDSVCETFGGSTRWAAMRATLLDLCSEARTQHVICATLRPP